MTADVIASLQASQSSIAAALAAIAANPKPTYSVGERSFSWSDYFRMLTEQLDKVTKLLVELQPYSVQSQVL